jgi:polyphenol oxidase
MKLLDWEDAPDGYSVAFTTRLGGVSEGDFESLNLGILTDDDPERVVENRRRICAAVGADAETATMAWQVHGGVVTEARPRGILERTTFDQCDGLWTETPGQAMALVTADCHPVAIARETDGGRGLCVLHVGWRGLLEGIVESGAAALRPGPLRAIVGPGIGPCCYEVGKEVLAAFEELGEGVSRGRMLDLTEVARRLLDRAGIESVVASGLCTKCNPELFFSHRRDGERTGRQAGLVWMDGCPG